MTIYLDIVFLENFLLNYIIMLSTKLITSVNSKNYKLVISSALSSLYSIIIYVWNIDIWIIRFIIKVGISVQMMWIAFGRKCLIRNLVFFYLISLFFGGSAFLLLFSINPEKIDLKENIFVGVYPVQILIIGAILSFLFIVIISIFLRIKRNRIEFYELDIFYKGKFVKVKALLDSGNLLKEPISKKDVVIVEKEALKIFFSKEVFDDMNNILDGKWIDSKTNNDYLFSLIPYSSLGNNNGLLIGFKPDYIKVYAEEEYLKNEVYIGIYDGKLTNNNLYTSLIGLEILNRKECINEFV